jgi:hypothetical protein
MSNKINITESSVQAIINKSGNIFDLKLQEGDIQKIIEKSKKLVEVFNNDLVTFQQVIEDITQDEEKIVSDDNSMSIIESSDTIQNKVREVTHTFNKQLESSNIDKIKRNLWEIMIGKTKEVKQREVQIQAIEYVKSAKKEFESLDFKIASSIDILNDIRNKTIKNNVLLAKKYLMFDTTVIFVESLANSNLEYIELLDKKITSIKRRQRTLSEIYIMQQKSILDMTIQLDMYDDLKTILNEYKLSALQIIALEARNNIILQDLYNIHQHLKSTKIKVNEFINTNSKNQAHLVESIHQTSKESILDKQNVAEAIEMSKSILDNKSNREKEQLLQIEQDNKDYFGMIKSLNSQITNIENKNKYKRLVNFDD